MPSFSSRITYIMAASRFAHYIKVIARDKIGSFAEATDVEAQLSRWIITTSTPTPGPDSLEGAIPAVRCQGVRQRGPGPPGSL